MMTLSWATIGEAGFSSLGHVETWTIAWIALPLAIGFSIYLLPKLARHLALAVSLVSVGYGLYQILMPAPLTLRLLDSFGVTLVADALSGFFALTNALVTAAVVLYCWRQGKSAFFYTQTIILHGSVNSAFICADFISLYVALEVISIAAFLLIAYPRTNRAIWIGLRYLFVSNTAMLFYLIGTVLVYQANQSFAFVGLGNTEPSAIALIFLGLLTKGGIFVSGFWLPMTHSESETPVSALLSGVVITVGVCPLVRCALLVDEIQPLIALFGMATALLGVTLAMLERDTKRMLALSTISQLGFVLITPAAAGFYALTHGLAKASLFLLAGNLPSRQFQDLQRQPLAFPLWGAIAIASLSISGAPLLAGFEAKALALKGLPPWQAIVMNVAAVGTAIALAKFIFLPWQAPAKSTQGKQIHPTAWGAIVLLLSGLLIGNLLHPELYTGAAVLKALATLGTGWLIHYAVLSRVTFKLSRGWEGLEHLIGAMSLMLTLLFWMVMA